MFITFPIDVGGCVAPLASLDIQISVFQKLCNLDIEISESFFMADEAKPESAPSDFAKIEEALFDRLLRHARKEIEAASRIATQAADSAARSAREAAEVVEAAASDFAGEMALKAKDAAGAVWDTIPSFSRDTARAAKTIRESRNKKSGDSIIENNDKIIQMLFRVPESMRDDIRQLALNERRQIDELLTESVLDLLLKYSVSPKIFEDINLKDK